MKQKYSLTKKDYEIIKNDNVPYPHDVIKKYGPVLSIFLIPMILYREFTRSTNKIWEKFQANYIEE